MELIILIIVVALVISGILLVAFPNFRRQLKTLLGGFLGLFVSDLAKTPEGAAAIYEQAIDEATSEYTDAKQVYMEVSGQLEMSKKYLSESETDLIKCERSCEILVKDNKLTEASLQAEVRESILSNIGMHKRSIEKLVPLVADAKEVTERCERDLIKLKSEKTSKIAELKVNQSLTRAYDRVDDLKRTSTSKEMLGKVTEGINEAQQNLAGSRVLHESKLTTRIEKAQAEADKLQTSEYISSLMNKYKTDK